MTIKRSGDGSSIVSGPDGVNIGSSAKEPLVRTRLPGDAYDRFVQYIDGTSLLGDGTQPPANVPGTGTFVTLPQATDKVVYVGSGTAANDANDGLTPRSAKATVQVAGQVAGVAKIICLLGDFIPPTNLPSNVVVEGVGVLSNWTTAAVAGTVTSLPVLGTNITIKDLGFKSTGTGGSVGLSTNGSTNVSIKGCRFFGTYTQAILVYQGHDVRISDNIFDTVGQVAGGDAINVYGSYDTAITGNTFWNCTQDAAYINASSFDVTFTGNTVRGGPEGVQVRVGCSDITITGNTFDIAGSATIVSFAVIVQSNCTDVVVGLNTMRATSGTAPTSMVRVDSSCFRVTVNGNNIRAAGVGFSYGIQIATSGAGGTESHDCTASNNTITGSTSYGIMVGANETNNKIVGNSVVASTGDTGINVGAANCTITGNQSRGNANHGIGVSGGHCTVSGNVCQGNGGAGILIANATDCTVTGNNCTGNTGVGVQEAGSADGNVITGNVVTGNTGGSITPGGTTSQIRGNVGYNPVGTVTPAVPATTVAVAAVSYDRTFYVTAGASATTMTIQNGPAVVVPASALGAVRVPAGKTVTPTYTAAPTWVVEAE